MLTKQHHFKHMKKVKTPEEARAWFDRHGISVAQWSRDHGFHQSLVLAVLYGHKKCKRGQSHNIAVLLGMKDGVLTATVGKHHKTARAAA